MLSFRWPANFSLLLAGLLPGTLREEMLSAGKISERTIRKEELHEASEVFLINSVAGSAPGVFGGLNKVWVPCVVPDDAP